MKNFAKILILLLAIVIVACTFVACDDGKGGGNNPDPAPDPNPDPVVEPIDYVSQLHLDMTANRAKITSGVSVKLFVDGDTTHFWVPSSIIPGGILKARYIAINTPESTGKIEDWGHMASRFTKEKLSNATSIVLESDTEAWVPDSTGSRYLTWVWYKTEQDTEYRNLNLEILQAGLARTSGTANNSYGEICMSALMQAQTQKLYVYSNDPDPEVYRGAAIELTLRELRTNIETYKGTRVAFEGVVTRQVPGESLGVYVEEYDEETDQYYGIYVFASYNRLPVIYDILTPGNRVRIVGNVEMWEAGGTWQITDVDHRVLRPTDANNIQKLGDGYSPSYLEITADQFLNGTVTIEQEIDDEIQVKTFDWTELAIATTVSMKNLRVISAYTTQSDTDSNGSITLTCQVDGQIIKVRTNPLYVDGVIVTQDAFIGQTIDIQGIVEYYQPEGSTNGSYQIKVLAYRDITIL